MRPSFLIFFLLISIDTLMGGKQVEEIPIQFIDWDKIDESQWVNFQTWKEDTQAVLRNDNWRQVLFWKENPTPFGLVVRCVGGCEIIREKSAHRPLPRSMLKSRDQIRTGKQSYMWLFTFAGDLVRLSPHTSVSLLEADYGKKQVFYHLRLNYGSLSRLPRGSVMKPSSLSETDPLFIPVLPLKANAIMSSREKFQQLDEEAKELLPVYPLNTFMIHQKKLEALMIENQSLREIPPSSLLLDTPAAQLGPSEHLLHAFYLLSGKSHFYVAQPKSEETTPLFSPSFSSSDSLTMESNQWFQFHEGKLQPLSNPPMALKMSELFTKRNPSLQLVREYWIREYSHQLFAAIQTGHAPTKKWPVLVWSQSDLKARIQTVMQQNQKHQAQNLAALTSYQWGEETKHLTELGPQFFERALNAYISELNSDRSARRQKMLYEYEREIVLWALKENFLLDRGRSRKLKVFESLSTK